jgi:hypothetical protein
MLMLIWIAFGILLFHKKWLVWCLVFCVAEDHSLGELRVVQHDTPISFLGEEIN